MPKLRHKNYDPIVIEVTPSKKNITQRCFAFLGELIFWMLSDGLCLLMICFGLRGVYTQKLPIYRQGKMSFGDDAVGFAWILVGVGIFCMSRFGYFLPRKPVLQLLGYIISIAAFLGGGWVLVRRLIH